MKRPYLDQIQRQIVLKAPDSFSAAIFRLEIAKARFRREHGQTLLYLRLKVKAMLKNFS